ncbi:SURF1 family protein [Psychromicrobium xiongbiense]|uniref:SURF1 family protein n=1 Tax=Psychromicrobium xiongbiense TaxID=3051184 RepID=UPI0025568EF9|nr:SURF1 family protein [Psychromicrobium sp. YIM S02556]
MLLTALKPRWIAALVLALVVATVFVLLSQWQFSRSTQSVDQPKTTTETARPLTQVMKPGVSMEASAADQVVTFSGHFDATRQVLVANRLLNGTNGYWVVTAFVVDGAPVLKGASATPYTVIPVARGWLADPSKVTAPPLGPLTVTGRLIPAESPVLDKNLPAGQVSALSTAELVNVWSVTSYQGFAVSFTEQGPSGDVGAHTVSGALQGISVGPQPKEQPVNWLNIFYAVEWVVFAGFAVFLWWRLVADDYRRQREALEDAQLGYPGHALRPDVRHDPQDDGNNAPH